MRFLKFLSVHLGQALAHYGGWGLLAVNFLDSSFLAFPVVNDLLLIHLAGQQPKRALVYALQATAGSVLGAYSLYGIALAGGRFLWHKSSPADEREREKLGRAHRWLERNEWVTLLLASLLPPPTPFKVFPIAAGMLRVNAARFGAALIVGRGLRFGAESFIGMHYGVGAEAFLKANIVSISLALAAIILAGTLAYRRLVDRNSGAGSGHL